MEIIRQIWNHSTSIIEKCQNAINKTFRNTYRRKHKKCTKRMGLIKQSLAFLRMRLGTGEDYRSIHRKRQTALTKVDS